MSILQELNHDPELVTRTIREAKDSKHFTTSRLAELTGIPESTLSKLLANPRSDPRVSTFIALCRALDLSADKVFNLHPPEFSAEDLRQRLHAAELENARLSVANKIRTEQLAARTPVIYTLLSACALQSCALIVYLFVDAQIEDAGLIRFGNFSTFAWLLLGLVLSAIGSCVWATMRFSHKSLKKEK